MSGCPGAGEKVRGEGPLLYDKVRGEGPLLYDKVRGEGPLLYDKVRREDPLLYDKVRGEGPLLYDLRMKDVHDGARSRDDMKHNLIMRHVGHLHIRAF